MCELRVVGDKLQARWALLRYSRPARPPLSPVFFVHYCPLNVPASGVEVDTGTNPYKYLIAHDHNSGH